MHLRQYLLAPGKDNATTGLPAPVAALHNSAEPSRAEPSRAEPGRAEPSRAGRGAVRPDQDPGAPDGGPPSWVWASSAAVALCAASWREAVSTAGGAKALTHEVEFAASWRFTHR